ncbi:DNA repair protein RecO [Patescibacteria group bacterium]|nr:DNA repair protein RecO [Patescibacteria group bacterium]MBU1922065.1 DNA repair protein RecO [Patescibacteria group bacterium]
MAITFRTESIVIKKEPWREVDRLYTLYTRRAGKLKVLARGSRKFESKLAAHMEPFLISDVMIARGKQFDKLAGSEQVSAYARIDKDLSKLAILNYCFEVLDSLTSFGQRDDKTFDLVKELLEIVEQNHLSLEHGSSLPRVFVLKLLAQLGYKPELNQCLECKRDARGPEFFFNSGRGGILCGACARQPKNQAFEQTQMSGQARQALKQWHDAGLFEFLRADLQKDTVQYLNDIVDDFLKYHIEKELKSEAYLREVVGV